MKKMIEQPEVKVVKMEAMNVIATSGDPIGVNTATVIVNDFSNGGW